MLRLMILMAIALVGTNVTFAASLLTNGVLPWLCGRANQPGLDIWLFFVIIFFWAVWMVCLAFWGIVVLARGEFKQLLVIVVAFILSAAPLALRVNIRGDELELRGFGAWVTQNVDGPTIRKVAPELVDPDNYGKIAAPLWFESSGFEVPEERWPTAVRKMRPHAFWIVPADKELSVILVWTDGLPRCAVLMGPKSPIPAGFGDHVEWTPCGEGIYAGIAFRP